MQIGDANPVLLAQTALSIREAQISCAWQGSKCDEPSKAACKQHEHTT